MSPFNIPNAPNTIYPDLAEPDSGDFSIIAQAANGFYVQSGCVPTVTGSDLNVTVASGVAFVNAVKVTVAGNAVVIPTAAGATNPRIDLIVVDATGIAQRRPSSGTANADPNPMFPSWNLAGETVIAAVYMPAGLAIIAATQLVDKRMLAQPHNGDAHTGDVLPNNSDQTLGTGSLTLTRRLTGGVPAPADNTTRVVYNQNYTSKTGTGLTATQLPRIVVKNNANTDIPIESPAYGIADWIIYKDSTNCYARNVRTTTIDYVGSSLHAVHNAAASATVNGISGVADGTANDLVRGCVIYLATPDTALEEYTTDASLVMQMGESLIGPGPGFKIRPSGTFPTGGGPTPANAIVDAYTLETATPARIVGRVNISGLTIDGKTPGDAAQPSNLIGILQRRPDNAVSPAGGDFSKSTIWNNEVYNVDAGGIYIGLPTDPGTNHATSNAWLYGNNVHDTTANSKNIAVYLGDCHILDGQQCQSNNGIPLYIAASTVSVVGESHYGLQGTTNTNACVWVASGTNTRIVGAYLDNIISPGIAGIYTAGSRLKVQNCWFNAGQIGTDLSVSAVRLDTAAECMIQGNQGAANNTVPTAVKNWKSLVDFVGGAGLNTGAVITNNSLMFCKNVFTGTAPTYFTNRNNKVTYDASNNQANYNSYFSDNEGVTANIATGATVKHGLDIAPSAVLVTPQDATPTSVQVTAKGGTTFTLAFAGGGSHPFAWRAWTISDSAATRP